MMQRRAVAIWLIAAGVCAVCAAVLFRFDPERCALYPPCLFHLFTGLYCPGCGSARALHHFLRGDMLTAITFNPLPIAVLPLAVYYLSATGLSAASGKAIPSFTFNWRFARGVLYVTVAYWVLRNIPVYPLTLLAPGSG